MSRKPTPQPEGRFVGGGGLAATAFSIPAVLLWLLLGMWWLLIFTIPLILYIAYMIYGVLLLLAASWRWRGTQIRGILVFSDSPNWRNHIEKNWMPRLHEQVVVLNWSERGSWQNSLEVRIFRRFGIGDDNFNFNPLLIYFRGLRYPLLYRCFFAFRDAKHGNPEALQRLERHMFARFQS